MSHRTRHDLLVFDYVPNLKIVGTYHALTQRHRDRLDSLIDNCDFLAVEWDEFRKKNQGYKTGSIMDYLYLSAFRNFTNFYTFLNKPVNEILSKKETEAPYCIRVGEEKGKDIYMVDQPIDKTLEKLLAQPLMTKISHILHYMTFFITPTDANKILLEERERFMMDEIIRYEGPLEKLKRKGLLVVGSNHAKNYRKQTHD